MVKASNKKEAGRSLPQWCGINLIAGKTTPLLLLEDDLIYAYAPRKSQVKGNSKLTRYRFAFDLGTNSIGWAVFELDAKTGKPIGLAQINKRGKDLNRQSARSTHFRGWTKFGRQEIQRGIAARPAICAAGAGSQVGPAHAAYE